jgi:large subunit ribosomal protein L6
MTPASRSWAAKSSAKFSKHMSRIGKLPIPIPDGVTITIDQAGVAVKGPKGTLNFAVPSRVMVNQADNQILVTVKNPDLQDDRALWGLVRMMVANMVTGVTAGFTKKLEINGVGYRAAVTGKNVTLNVGYSHPVEFAIPDGIEITVEKNVVSISGIDKQLVGETAAKIRSIRKPEPYKGKGIKYSDEVIRRKAGKVVKAAGAK